MVQSKLKKIHVADAKRGKTSKRATIGFTCSFTSDWIKKWREFSSQSRSVVKQNQLQKKIALSLSSVCSFDSSEKYFYSSLM